MPVHKRSEWITIPVMFAGRNLAIRDSGVIKKKAGQGKINFPVGIALDIFLVT
jgi:hypothetical protein